MCGPKTLGKFIINHAEKTELSKKNEAKYKCKNPLYVKIAMILFIFTLKYVCAQFFIATQSYTINVVFLLFQMFPFAC